MYMHVFVFICNYFYKYLKNYTQSFLLIKHIIMFIIGKYVFVYTQLHIHICIFLLPASETSAKFMKFTKTLTVETILQYF